MPFSSLLGNRRIKDNLTGALRQGKLGHFYLISGPVGSGKKTLARLLAASAMCDGADKPCLHCPSCRKVLGGVHPDVIFVEDPEHKAVPVRIIRQMRDDVFIRPNEGARKIYIFPQEIGIEGQNALLKILEEPPAYGLFLLLAENPEKFLPTVRSRCVELAMQRLDDDVLRDALRREFPQADAQTLDAAVVAGGGFLGQAKQRLRDGMDESPQTADFVQALCAQDALLLTRTLVPMEKWKRDPLIALLGQWLQILEGALVIRCGGHDTSAHAQKLAHSRSAEYLNRAIGYLQTCITYAQGNVSPAAVCGYLCWVLR